MGLVAVVLATVNMVGGFVVTDRMLEMFKAQPPKRARDRRMSRDVLPDLDRARLPGRRGLLHPRAEGALVARPPRGAAT